MRTVKSLLLLAVPLAACDRDLSRSAAAEELAEHYEMHAPSLADSLEVRVSEILNDGPDGRNVRHRLFFHSAGALDSSDVLVGRFVRGDGGWTLERYDAPMIDALASLGAMEIRAEYADLLDVLEQIASAAHKVDTELHRRWMEAAKRRDLDGMLAADEIEPAALLSAGYEPPEGYEWGITPAAENDAQVAWVRPRTDTLVMCADRVTYGRTTPVDFYWVDEIGETCRGRFERDVNVVYASDSIKVQILRSGGVLLQPAFRKRR